jgi:two-component sensor histidine kinase
VVRGNEVESWEFPLADSSIPAARARLRTLVKGKLTSDAVEVAGLLLTELATNAVMHARTPFTVAVIFVPTGLRIHVDDGSSRQPRLVGVADRPGTPGGWGLQLVDQMATRWGVDVQAEGKSVWFELDRADLVNRLG